MSNFVPALRNQTTDLRADAPIGINAEVVRKRKAYRRQTLAGQTIGYLSSALVIAIYAYAGRVQPEMAFIVLLCGMSVILFFLVSSEIGFNDKCKDHYLSFPQVVAHTILQSVFLAAMPEVGYIFLNSLFITFSFGALRMSSQQSVMSLSLMALCVVPSFLLMSRPVIMPSETQAERFAATLCFVWTIAQCAFVGRFGSALRIQSYANRNQLQIAYQRIEELAQIDELTGAFNRRSIMSSLNNEIARANRLQHPCTIALIDLDWFKRINDTLGHLAGDEVLRTFAITSFANIRSIDAFGRYGGEEFLLVLPQTPHDEAMRTLTRLRLIVSELDWSALSPDLSVTISAGVATLLPNETAESVLARADAALYNAKRGGRNRVDAAA